MESETKFNVKAKCKETECKYVNTAKGCRRGTQCWYSHGHSDTHCKYWRKGFCKFSNKKCKYKHELSKRGIKLETNKMPENKESS